MSDGESVNDGRAFIQNWLANLSPQERQSLETSFRECLPMLTEIEAARTLIWRAAWMVDNDASDALRVISMAKLFASETYVKVANVGMQIFGGAGYSMEFDMQRHFRDARSTTIAAGTSQMQRNVIAGLIGLKVK